MLAAAHGLVEEVTHTAASKRTATEQRKMFKVHEIEEMRNVQYRLTWKQVAQVVHPWGPHKQQGTSLA